jgi:hypothetical protein
MTGLEGIGEILTCYLKPEETEPSKECSNSIIQHIAHLPGVARKPVSAGSMCIIRAHQQTLFWFFGTMRNLTILQQWLPEYKYPALPSLACDPR